MNEFVPALEEAASQDTYFVLTNILNSVPPSQVNPTLDQGVRMVEAARTPKKFVPMQGLQDPAAMQFSMMRSLLPPQVGMLLVTVPHASGMLSMANGSYYVFCTDSKYVIIMAESGCRSQLMTVPAGVHRLLITCYGWWDKTEYPKPPYLLEQPTLKTLCDVDVQPGLVTEVVVSRASNFKNQSCHIVYHS